MWDKLMTKIVKIVLLSGFVYTCTVNWFYVHLYCKLVLCTPVLQICFVYTCTANLFCVHMYCKLVLCTSIH